MAKQAEDKSGAVSQPWKPTDTINLPDISTGLQNRTGMIKPVYLDTGRGVVKVSDRFIRNTDPRLNQFGIQRYNPGLPGIDAAWERQGQSFWQDSRRIGRYYQAIQSLPYGVQPPEWLDIGKLTAAYTDLSNEFGSDWTNWGVLAGDHPVNLFMAGQPPPPLAAIPQWEQDDLAAVSDALKTDTGPIGEWTQYGIDYDTWNKLPEWKKWANRGFRSMGGQMFQQAVNLGVGGAYAAGVPGFVAGASAGALMGYLGTKENERAMEMGENYKPGATFYVMGALNFLFTQAQQGMAFRQQIQNALVDPEQYGSVADIFKDIPAAWEAGEGFYSLLPYEVGSALGKDGKVRVINIAGEDTFIEGAGKGVMGSGVALAEIRRMLSDGKLSPAQVREYTIQRYGGFAGEMTDLLAGFALDPLDLIGPVTGGIIGNVADKTGNVPLAKSLLAPTGQGELLSGYRRYRQELRQMPVDDLRKMSNAAQWFAGVDKSGQDVTLRQTQRGFVDKMFGATPQARADESLHQFVDGMSTMLDMEQGNVDGMYRIAVAMAGTPGQAVDAVANGKVKVSVGGVLTDVDMPRWSLSAEAQVVPLMLKDQMPKVKDHYDLYRNTRPQANLLTRISEALGEDMYRTIADLHTGKADYDGVMKRIVALANEGNKAAADFVKNTAGMKDLNNAALKKAADLFSGEGGAAFDGKMWGVQLMHILSEGAEKWAVDWFGIKPSGWAMRLGDVIKKAQSQMLLGLNPSYLANNAINNIVTLAWDGLFSNLSKKQRMEWIRRYGYTTQLRKGMGGAEIGEMEAGTIPGAETGKAAYKLGKHLREATRAKDGIQKAQDLIGGGNKFMAAAILSQKVERWSSEIATVKGTMEYWDGYWRAGVGFDKMTGDLRMVLDGVQKGLADRVEKAIARGMNKSEIEKEVFTRLEVPSLRDVMSPEELGMMSSFPGLMNEIDKGMRDAVSNEDRRAVFQQAIKGMEKQIDEDISRKAVIFVHQTAAKVQAEGYAGAFDVMDTLVPERHEFWQQHMQHMDDVAMQAESLTGLERANLWREELASADREWRTFHNAEGYKWFGIFEGLGAERTSETGVMVERNLMDVHSVWDNFYNNRKTLMDEYFGYVDTTDFTGLSKEEARAVRSAKWGEINEKLNAAYGEAIIVEDLYQSELDRLFYKQYAQQFGTDAGMAAIKWRDEQRKIRRTMVEAQLLWRTANLSEHIQKSFGGLLPKETIEKILLLNGNEPIYKMSVGERDKANQKFYREIYRPLLGEMMKAPVIEKLKPGKPKVEKPVVEKPAVVAKPKEPEQSTVWKYIAETRPEMAGIDENGRPNPDAKLNIIKWLRKWSQTARDNNVKKWAEVTPALIHEAAQAEDYFNSHQPELTETAPEIVPVEEPALVTETVTEAPAEPVQEVGTEPVTPVKQTWEMTALEYAKHEMGRDDILDPGAGYRAQHFSEVRSALARGDSVPDNVLADYPDLAAQFPTDADLTATIAEEARFTEGMTPEAAAEVEQAQQAAAAREQVIAQAESMRQNVDEIMRLAPPKEVNGEIFREYIHQIMADKYPDKPSHGANRADAVWTVIDRIATTLAEEQGISKDEWYNNFVLSRGGERIWGDNALYRMAEQNTLQALHNLSFDDLLEADRLGGMPVPSIAVLKKGQQFSDFGNITMVGRRPMIDPGASGYNKVYASDAYTATRPQPVYGKVVSKYAQELVNSLPHMREFDKNYSYTGSIDKLWDAMVNYPSRDSAESALRSRAGEYQFLREKGIDITPVYMAKSLYKPWLSSGDEIINWYKGLDNPPAGYNIEYGSDMHKTLSELTRKSYEQEVREKYGDYEDIKPIIKKIVMDFYNEDGLLRPGYMDRVIEDLKARATGEQQINTSATNDAIDAVMEPHRNDFNTWVNDKLGIFSNPRIVVKGKKLPITLENIVDAMTYRDPRGKESSMFASDVYVRANLTKRFKSIADIHKLEDRLVTKEAFQEWKKGGSTAEQLIDTYTSNLRSHDSNQFIAYDQKRNVLLEVARTKRISKEGIRSQLIEWGWNDPSDIAVEAAYKYLTILDNAPTEYFEAKPQRGVEFGEWAGAVVPDDAPQEVLDVLKRRGVEYKTYKANDATSRQEAVQSFYDREGVLFRTDPEQFYARLDRLEYQRTDDGIDYTLHFKNKESTGDLLTYEEARTVLGEDLTAQILAGEDAGIITGADLRKLKPGGYSVRGASGATYWLDNGKAVMHAFSRADIADVMHEYIHAITPLLPEADLRTIERWYAKEYGRKLGADWMDKTYPDADVFEKLARAFERYMTEGPTGFTGEILQALENIKAWMLDIYKNLTHADIDIRMNSEIRAMFDRWLGQEPKKITEPASVEPTSPSVWQKRPQQPAATEKVGAWGWTKEQEQFITGAIDKHLSDLFPADIIKGMTNTDKKIAEKFYVTVSDGLYRKPVVIEIPDGGMLRLTTLDGMNDIYYALTGKKLANIKTMSRKPSGKLTFDRTPKADTEDWMTNAYYAAVRLYGDTEKAAAKVKAQIEQMAATEEFDTQHANMLLDQLERTADVSTKKIDGSGTSEFERIIQRAQAYQKNFLFRTSTREITHGEWSAREASAGNLIVERAGQQMATAPIDERGVPGQPSYAELTLSERNQVNALLAEFKQTYQQRGSYPPGMLYRVPTDNEGAPLNEPPAQNAPLGTADELMGVPVEEITMAGWNQHLRPALERAQNAMLSQTVGKIDLDESLPQEGKVALRNYLGQVYSQMADVKMGATRWGESRRNAALLDYNKRTGVDNTILGIFPYQFWYTRTAINWALRVLNKPSIAANYYRLLRMSQRKEERDGYPRRLKGKIAFPMPWLPDFMGDNIYIDPWKQALPILQMTRPFERAAEEKNQAARRTQQLIYDMVDSGEITDEQAQQAITDKGGAIYIKAKAQAENESERDFQNPLDFAFALSNPLLPISVAYDVATGRADRISQLPFTRLVQNLTAMAGIGGPRGVNLEAGIRKAAGLPTIDRFEDYRVDRELASMTADGLIDADTATTAMIDRTGQVFEDAQRRVSQQGAIRYFGTALALDLFPEGEAKQRGLQDEFAAAYDAKAAGDVQAVNKFFDKYPEYGARLASFKEPEERMRAFLRGIVWEKYLALPKAQSKKFREAAGDVFAEAFLDSETRSYDSISTDTLAMWANSLGETPETASKSELPVDWLDDETAKQIDTYYNERTRIFGEYDPNAEPDPNYSLWQNQYLAQHPNLIQYVIGETNALYGLPQDIQVYVYQYRAARDMRYPNIFNVQDKYFTITNSTQKKSFIKAHPELKEYWGWRKQMAANFPKAAAYIMSEDSLAAEILDEDYVNYSGNIGGGGSSTNTGGGNYGGSTYSDGRPAEGYHPPYLTGSELKRFSRPLVMQLLAMFYRNEGLMTGANNEITAIWEELGKPFGTLADFIEYAVRPTLTQ